MRNINRFTRTLFSAVCLLLCVGMLGCRASAKPEATATPIAIPTATPEPQPVAGGELYIPIPRNPFKSGGGTSASPLIVNTEEMRNMYSLVYEPLLRCDANNRIIPSLAEKWSSDDTGRVWTIRLRANVMWQDGSRALKADDVTYTIAQIKNLGNATYYSLAADSIETCEKVDDSTVRITMNKAGMASLYALVFPVVCADSSIGGLNGTGPYKLASSTEDSVELTANPAWWKQAPYIQTIHCLARESNEVALDSYEAGQLNLVPTSTVSAGKYREEGVTNVLDVMTQDAEVLLINHSNSILENPDVRKAIAYAMDRGSIVSNVYMNRAAICDVPIPPDSFLYDATTKIYDYNADKAKSLLTSAGWTDEDGDGMVEQDGRALHLRLLVNESTESTYRKNAAALIASQLSAVGIETEVVAAKLSIGETNGDYEQKLVSGDFDIALAGFNLEPSGNLSPYLSAGGSRNYGKIAGSQWSELMGAAAAAKDENGMKQTQSALQQAFVRDLPFIMLYFRMNSVVYSAQIKNVSEVRATDVLRTVSRWYMKTAE